MLRKMLVSAASVLAGSLCSEAVFASPSSLSAPAAGARLEPGSVQAITWSLEADKRGFGEMELVLSLDGGRTFPVRVTRRIDPAETVWLWGVPALPTEHARLGLRVGDDDPPSRERLALVSAEFTIASPSPSPLAEMFWVGGEVRTRDALDGPPQPTLPDSSARSDADSELITASVDETTQKTTHASGCLRRRASAKVPEIASRAAKHQGPLETSRSPVRLPMRL